jgi:hypothetical protein
MIFQIIIFLFELFHQQVVLLLQKNIIKLMHDCIIVLKLVLILLVIVYSPMHIFFY